VSGELRVARKVPGLGRGTARSAYLGARRPGPVIVLSVNGAYGRIQEIFVDALDTVARAAVERREGRRVGGERGRHGHG
jgi:hypothetical protein